jgi:hypothetical protein
MTAAQVRLSVMSGLPGLTPNRSYSGGVWRLTALRPGERIHPAQRVRQPVGSGHRGHEGGGAFGGNAGRGDVQRSPRIAAAHRNRVAGRAERRLGHSDDRDVQLGVQMCPEPGPSLRVQVDIAVDDDQRYAVAEVGQHGPQRGQFAGVEQLLTFCAVPSGGPVTAQPSRPVSNEVLVPSGSVMSSMKTPMPWKAQSLA